MDAPLDLYHTSRHDLADLILARSDQIADLERRVAASISIAGPAPRMPEERIARLGEEVWLAAVSRQLGYTRPETNGFSPPVALAGRGLR